MVAIISLGQRANKCISQTLHCLSLKLSSFFSNLLLIHFIRGARLRLYLFEWKHFCEDIVMAQGLMAGPQDGQDLCFRTHQQLCDANTPGQSQECQSEHECKLRKKQKTKTKTGSFLKIWNKHLSRDGRDCSCPHTCDDVSIHDLQGSKHVILPAACVHLIRLAVRGGGGNRNCPTPPIKIT